MSKKIASLIVIICTLIYSSITLYCSTDADEISSSITVANFLRDINIGGILKGHSTPKVTYDVVKEKPTIGTDKNIETSYKGITNREQKLPIMSMPKSVRDMKLLRIHQSDKELLDSIFSKAVFKPDEKSGLNVSVTGDENKKQNVASGTIETSIQKKEDKGIPAFSIQNNKAKSELSVSDRERLLSIAKKLSPIDQVKINEYIKDENLVINALNLLRDRLSDIEFDKIKDIAEKYNKLK